VDADVDVAVVGAGLSGLRCAELLQAGGAQVVVLEARDRVGGRTLSTRVDDDVFDLGGQWLGAGQPRLAALARRLGIETYPQYATGRKVLEVGGRVRTYRGTIPKLAPWNLAQLQLARMRLERLARRARPDDVLATPRADRLDALTVERWADRALYGRTVVDLFAAAVRVVFGAELGDLSMLYFLAYLRAGGGLTKLLEIDGGAQQERFVGGAQQLSSGLAAHLGDRVLLSWPVREIAHNDPGVTLHAEHASVRARICVLALAPPLWHRIAFSPPIPSAHDSLARHARMGGTVKVLATFERAFWRDRGMSGEAVFDRDPVTATFDATTHGGKRPALLAFVVGRAARDWSSRDRHERRTAVLQALARAFGPSAMQPRQVIEQDWGREDFSGGCPVASLANGALSVCAPAMRAPFGRVHIAGTEMAVEWTGYLEGALESAERTAREVLATL
jgi:monoamine oxidase